MRKFSFTLVTIFIAALFGLSSCKEDKSLPSCTGIHWNYDNTTEEGPALWGELCVDYTSCNGTVQSPVDIAGAQDDAALTALSQAFGASGTHAVNNGHTIQFNTDEGTSLTLDGQTFKLIQFHVHTPSEHTVNGVSFPMELHFVHKNETTGKLAVIGVLVKEGAENDFLKPLVEHLPAATDEKYDDATEQFNIADFLPSNKSYFTYGGSLTTPPCSEIVTWLVMENSVEASHAQIEDFHNLEHSNNRPIQLLNGRSIKHFHI